jgi:hypothetical protein
LVKETSHAAEPLEDGDTLGPNVEWEQLDQEGCGNIFQILNLTCDVDWMDSLYVKAL